MDMQPSNDVVAVDEPMLSDPDAGEEAMLCAIREEANGLEELKKVGSSPILLPDEEEPSFARSFNEQLRLPGVDGFGGGAEDSAEEKILPGDTVQWMWGESNLLATHNPWRWSSWQHLHATVVDLQKYAKDVNKVVKLRSQRDLAILSFGTVDEAIAALRNRVEEALRDALRSENTVEIQATLEAAVQAGVRTDFIDDAKQQLASMVERQEQGTSASESTRKSMPTPETKLAFSPGALGMIINKYSGRVDRVKDDGQAQKHGVHAGMIVQTIDEQPYSCELLGEKVHGDEDYELTFVEEWGVARRQKPTITDKLSMVIPTVTRVAFGLIGATAVGAGYGVGKLVEVAGGNKAVDSATFRAGFTSYLWSNGVFPSVQYESLGAADEALTTEYDMATPPQPNDVSLTPVIVSNHVSYLDGVVLASVFGAPKIMAKADARNTPVLGHLMEEMEVVFVKREEGNSRKAALDAIETHCKDWTPGKRPLLIFPEGTTTNGESLAPFKKGAFSAGTPVRPVVIVYTGSFDPSNPHYVETEDGLEETSDKEWAARFLGGFIHSLHIRVLAPYFPSEVEKNDAALYTANFEAFYAKEFVRVREEVLHSSWKVAAGRTDGGMGYQPFDVIRTGARIAVEKSKELGAGLTQAFVHTKTFQCVARDKTEDAVENQ